MQFHGEWTCPNPYGKCGWTHFAGSASANLHTCKFCDRKSFNLLTRKKKRQPPQDGSWANADGKKKDQQDGKPDKSSTQSAMLQRMHENYQQAEKNGDPPEVVEQLKAIFKKHQQSNFDAKPPSAQARTLDQKINTKKEAIIEQEKIEADLERQLDIINESIKTATDKKVALRKELIDLQTQRATIQVPEPGLTVSDDKDMQVSHLLKGIPLEFHDDLKQNLGPQFETYDKQVTELHKNINVHYQTLLKQKKDELALPAPVLGEVAKGSGEVASLQPPTNAGDHDRKEDDDELSEDDLMEAEQGFEEALPGCFGSLEGEDKKQKVKELLNKVVKGPRKGGKGVRKKHG